MNPKQILNSLIAFDRPMESLLSDLQKVIEQSGDSLAIMVNKDQVRQVVERTIQGELSFDSLKDWAIEISRFSTTHLVFARQDEEVIRPVLFELSEAERTLSPYELSDLAKQLA